MSIANMDWNMSMGQKRLTLMLTLNVTVDNLKLGV